MANDNSRPWLLGLATRQRGRIQEVGDGQVYHDDIQMTVRLEEPHILAIEHGAAPKTKKADIETGEDQK
jgi:hypothetical protein